MKKRWQSENADFNILLLCLIGKLYKIKVQIYFSKQINDEWPD